MTNYWEYYMLQRLFGVAGGHATLADWQISLHTATPGETGQFNHEINATYNVGYIRCRYDCNVLGGNYDWEVSGRSVKTVGTYGQQWTNSDSSAWTTVIALGLNDHNSNTYNDTMAFHFSFDEGFDLAVGESKHFVENELVITVDDNFLGTNRCEQLLKHLFEYVALSQPTNTYVGLSSTDPKPDLSGLTENFTNSYARVLFNTWEMASVGAPPVRNNGDITFTTATGDWHGGGDILYWTIWDHATSQAASNFIGYGSFSTYFDIGNNEQVVISDNDLNIYLN